MADAIRLGNIDTLTFFQPFPLSFAIYKFFGYTAYALNGLYAYHSFVSPGVHEVLSEIIKNIKSQYKFKTVIVDDLFGLMTTEDCSYSVFYEDYLKILESIENKVIKFSYSINRNTKELLDSFDFIVLIPPVASFFSMRLPDLSIDVINSHPDKAFIIPTGRPTNTESICSFYSMFVKNHFLYSIRFPTICIDSNYLLVFPERLQYTVSNRVYIKEIQKIADNVYVDYDYSAEKMLFTGCVDRTFV